MWGCISPNNAPYFLFKMLHGFRLIRIHLFLHIAAKEKKSIGVKSHDLGGQCWSPNREMTTLSVVTRIVSRAVWQVALSCWKNMSSTSITFNSGHKNSVNISRYHTPLTELAHFQPHFQRNYFRVTEKDDDEQWSSDPSAQIWSQIL